ncbi:MAG: cysteine desulfurase [Nitrospinae bacterium]|nr:cysteine desulfurase [Nitrospinota bacterium]
MQKIYLDHNATTPIHPEVLEVMLPVMREFFGNPSSIHSEGRKARVFLDEAREQVADLIGATPGEIIFTSGGTESNNMVLLGVALSRQKNYGRIITCEIEHPSILNPCKQLEQLGLKIDCLPVNPKGRIDLERLEETIQDSTVLISLQHSNSEVGTLQDIEKIGEISRENPVTFHTDAVQSVGKIPVDVKNFSVDFLSISSHKLNGPKGVGALFMKRGLPALFSTQSGGNQEKKRRGGTENVAAIVGFGKACELAKTKLESGAMNSLANLRDYFFQRIKALVPGIELLGDKKFRLPNTLNLSIDGADGGTLLIGLDVEGISVSTGSACSSGSSLPSHVLTAMQVPERRINSSLRFSLGILNTREELDIVAKTLARLVPLNRKNTIAVA